MRGPFSKRRVDSGRQRGGVLVLFAVCLLVMLCVLGLAIDTGMAYFAKSRLSLAADSAVLAAADAYTHDTDPNTQERSARDAAAAYFRANYPVEFLADPHRTGTLDISTAPKGVYLKYSAQAASPLTFGRLMSSQNLSLSTAPVVLVQNKATPKRADILMVLDLSSSMDGHTEDMKTVLMQYVLSLDSTRTKLAIMTFNTRPRRILAFDPRISGFDKTKAIDKLASSIGRPGGYTGLLDALQEAKQILSDDSLPQGDQKIIMLVSDGGPSSEKGTPYPGNFDPLPFRLYENVMDEAIDIQKKNIQFYAIGWGNLLKEVDCGMLPCGIHGGREGVPHSKIGKSTGEDLLRCISGDPNYPPSTITNCRTPQVSPDSRYCSSPDFSIVGLERCVLQMHTGTTALTTLVH